MTEAQVKALALREAADDLDDLTDGPGWIEDQAYAEWLRARADRIENTPEP